MISKVAVITIWVPDQEAALDFYVNKLGFEKRTDDAKTVPGYRWLTVAPKKQTELEIVLGLANSPEQRASIGKNSTWVLHTDDCRKEYETLKAKGVKFTQEPADRPYAVEALFVDPFGNEFDLVQPKSYR